MDVELQYKENKDSLYVNNVLKTSINWNESFANTILNGTNTRQAVEPRKRHLRDEFSVIKKFRNNKPKSVIRISLCRTAKRNPLIFPI